MSKKVKKYIYLLLAIALMMAGVGFDNILSQQSQTDVEIKNFESVLRQKEGDLNALMQQTLQKIKLHEFREINGIMFFDSLDYEGLEQNDLYLVVYEFDTLKFWSDNHLDLSYILDDRFDLNVNKLGNTWYEITVQHFGEYTIVGLIKLKDEYPYSNKYLVDRFAKGFKIAGNFQISLIPVSYGYDIHSSGGDYLFTLVPENTQVAAKKHSNVALVFYFLAIFLLLTYLFLVIREKSRAYGIFVILVLVVLRILMLVYRFPGMLYAYPLFSPVLGFYSIGDLIIDLSILLFVVRYVNARFDYAAVRSDSFKPVYDYVVFSVLSFVLISAMFFFYDLFVNFIVESKLSFEVYKILNLSFESISAILAFGLGFMIIFYVYEKILRTFVRYLRFKGVFSVMLITYLVIFAVNLLFGGVSVMDKLWILFGLVILVLTVFKADLGLSYLMLEIALIAALIVTDVIFVANNHKFEITAKRLAVKVQNLRDPVAEQLLRDLEGKIKSDEVLKVYLEKDLSDRLQQKITHYLYKEYFQGYWKKYDLSVKICTEATGYPDYTNRQVCANRYGELIARNGQRLTDNLNFISNETGIITYLLTLHYGGTDLYIELSPKILPRETGYPELLLDTNIDRQIPENFSYAKYYNGNLIVKYGDFDYPSTNPVFSHYIGTFVDYRGFRHYTEALKDKASYVVVSYPKVKVLDLIITFSYLFVFFMLAEIVFMLTFGFSGLNMFSRLTLRNKFILSMIGILTIAFLSLGTVTVYFNVKKFKDRFESDVRQKLHSAVNALELNMDPSSGTKDQEEINNQLRTISEILNADINLYSSNGQLLGTSRKKIFENKLLGRFINHRALYDLLYEQKNDFITQEQIGLLKYTSAYAAITYPQGEVTGYVNIPFFTNPNELHEQVSNLIVTLINLYVVLFLITVAIAVLMSEQVIAPIKVLQQKFQRLKLGQKYEKIDYKRKDEIGQLVEEYNKMVEKLEQSIDLLAKSERESAWRDMAKQIAHEIKNPLTPMKLSIQLLQRAWDNKDKNFDKRIKEVTNTLIEQIETLRNIAEEFSAFAKMPVSENEKIDLAQKIENIVKLYENIENVQVKAVIKRRPVYIWADNKQISRVFINLIKNAVQAIPEGQDGKVIVELDVRDDKALVKVSDNGTGIAEDIRSKLFTPSFTTKSSGMGLGLAMVKNIIQNAKGRIWFDTEVGKGTTFYIEFPLYNDSAQEEESDDKPEENT